MVSYHSLLTAAFVCNHYSLHDHKSKFGVYFYCVIDAIKNLILKLSDVFLHEVAFISLYTCLHNIHASGTELFHHLLASESITAIASLMFLCLTELLLLLLIAFYHCRKNMYNIYEYRLFAEHEGVLTMHILMAEPVYMYGKYPEVRSG